MIQVVRGPGDEIYVHNRTSGLPITNECNAAQDSGHSLHAICVNRDTGAILHDIEVFRVERGETIGRDEEFAHPLPVPLRGGAASTGQGAAHIAQRVGGIPPPGRHPRLEARVLAQNGRFEGHHRWRRVDPQLVGQPDAEPLVGPQRVGLSPAAVQRQHERRPPLLPQRLLGHRRFGVPDHVFVLARLQPGQEQLLDGDAAQLLESRRLGSGPRLVGDVLQRTTPPQTDRRPQGGRRRLPIPSRQPCRSAGHESFELGGIEARLMEFEDVPACSALKAAAQNLAELGHVTLQGRRCRSGRGALPDILDQRGGGNDTASVKEQPAHERPAPGAAQGKGLTGAPGLGRPEHLKVDFRLCHRSLARRPASVGGPSGHRPIGPVPPVCSVFAASTATIARCLRASPSWSVPSTS